MKTPEELNALKEEFKALNKKLAELTEEELNQVTGGVYYIVPKSRFNDDRVNPEDSCQFGVCGSCKHYIAGHCVKGKA